jgi:hypothetical protein
MTTIYVKKPQEFVAAQLTAKNDTRELVDLGCSLANGPFDVLLVLDTGAVAIPLNGWVTRAADPEAPPNFQVWSDKSFRATFAAK